MFEKVTPAHPDKIADRIAGAIVDLAYAKERDPRIAVEILIGHGICHIICETSGILPYDDIASAVHRIAGKNIQVDLRQYPQDKYLAANQDGRMRLRRQRYLPRSPGYARTGTAHGAHKGTLREIPCGRQMHQGRKDNCHLSEQRRPRTAEEVSSFSKDQSPRSLGWRS